MRLARVERSLLFAGVFVGIVAHGPGAFAQNVPAAPAPGAPAALAPGAPATPAASALPPGLMKLRGGQDRIIPGTRKEAGARITGIFTNDAVLSSAADKIRLDAAGPCNSVTSAINSGSAAVVCDGGKHSYFMQRGATEWTYLAPPLIAAKNRPAGQ